MATRRFALFMLPVAVLVCALGAGCAGRVCEVDDSKACSCEYGGPGVAYCLADGSGFDRCICPIKSMEIRPHVKQLDDVASGKIERVGTRGLKIPLSGHEELADLQPGENFVSFEAGLGGRVTSVTVADGYVVIETETCPIGDVFSELDIDMNDDVNLLSGMDPERRRRWRSHSDASRLKQLEQGLGARKEVTQTETGVAGLSFEPKLELNGWIDILDGTHFTLKPKIFFQFKLGGDIVSHFALVPMLNVDMLIHLRAFVELAAYFTAEIELVAFLACALFPEFGCCEDGVPCSPLRTPIAGGITLWTWLTLGCEFGADGSVELETESGFEGKFAGGILYSNNWSDSRWTDGWGDDSTWDEIRDQFQADKSSLPVEEFTTWKYDRHEGSAEMVPPFIWTLHGGVKCYVKPKMELSFLEMGGGFIEGGPYVAFDAYLDRNSLQFTVGVEADAGVEINPLGTGTLWEWTTQVLDESLIIWQYLWKWCGDGWRNPDPCPNRGVWLPEILGNDCADEDQTAGEECDPGFVFFNTPGQGFSDFYGTDLACIPYGQPGACTCGPGYAPREHLEVSNWEDFPELHRGFWGDGNNLCVPNCGNDQLDVSDGEVCDPGKLPWYQNIDQASKIPSLGECYGGCTKDCSRVVGVCGDGRTECWETCDDGKQCRNGTACQSAADCDGIGDGTCLPRDCDGCDKWCQTEVNLRCGDRKVCPPEKCDDGNNVSDDGCSADCLSSERCGDGVVDPTRGEECDDGNWIDGDGCDWNCTVSRCGNGVPYHNGGEECDDGSQCTDGTACRKDSDCAGIGDGSCAPRDCDGCQSNCKRDPGFTSHGCFIDGIVCPWEQCDDGNWDNCDACHNNCTPNGGCGDGHPCHSTGEECDLGTGNRDCGCETGEFDCDQGDCIAGSLLCDGTADCANGTDEANCGSCTAGQFRCGSGACVSATVLCDQTANCADGSDEATCLRCSTRCEIRRGGSYCGDGYRCGAEECDPNVGGSWTDCGACLSNCRWKTGCGDGMACEGEVCDDGNAVAGDGCSAECMSNETCGNGIVDIEAGEVCDDGNRTAGDGCRADCRGREVCGDGWVDHAAGEGCEDTSPDGIDAYCNANTPDCILCIGCTARCGDGIKVAYERCDITPDPHDVDPGCTADLPVCNPDCSGCGPDCSASECGDGVLCPGEECDDANRADCDGCNSDCTVTRCGDGLLCGAEVCDDGNAVGGDGCRADCLGVEICGDGLVDLPAGEGCEDTSLDDVDAGCTAYSPYCYNCIGCITWRCGNGVIDANSPEVCDGNTQPCTDPVTMYQGVQACLGDCMGWDVCVATEYCGDGTPNGWEECDDGDQDDCNGCTTDCTPTTGCGDGFTCGTEQCDDGKHCADGTTPCDGALDCTGIGDGTCAPRSCDGCHADCQLQTGCGDEKVCGAEVCDDGNNDNCVGYCNADCSAFRSEPVCNDGTWDTECEVCEDTNPTGQDDGCAGATPNCIACAGCHADICGDGIIGPDEVCDNGGICLFTEAYCTTLNWETVCTDPNDTGCFPMSGDGCRDDCQKIEICGDGELDTYEICEETAPPGEIDLGCDAAHPNCDLANYCWTCY